MDIDVYVPTSLDHKQKKKKKKTLRIAAGLGINTVIQTFPSSIVCATISL